MALIAVDAVLDELVADRRRAAAQLAGGLRDRPPASDEELNPVPFVYDHLFHGVLSFRVGDGVRGMRPESVVVGGIEYRIGTGSESKRTFPSREGG